MQQLVKVVDVYDREHVVVAVGGGTRLVPLLKGSPTPTIDDSVLLVGDGEGVAAYVYGVYYKGGNRFEADVDLGLRDNYSLNIITDFKKRARFDAGGDVIFGGDTSLLTTDARGYVWMPACADVPAQPPALTPAGGQHPMVWVETKTAFYYWDGAEWVPFGSGTGGGGTVGIDMVIDSSPSTLVAGYGGELIVPFACEVVEAYATIDRAGSITLDIGGLPYADYPDTGASPPSPSYWLTPMAFPEAWTFCISGGRKAHTADPLTDHWRGISIGAGDTLVFNISRISAAQRCNISLVVRRV